MSVGFPISKMFWTASKFILAFAGSRPFVVPGLLPTGYMRMIVCPVCSVARTSIRSLITSSVQCFGNLLGKFVLLRSVAPSPADCVSSLLQRTNFAGLPLCTVSFMHAKMIQLVSSLMHVPTYRPLLSLGLLAPPDVSRQSWTDNHLCGLWSLTWTNIARNPRMTWWKSCHGQYPFMRIFQNLWYVPK